jgi:hypothetical protein
MSIRLIQFVDNPPNLAHSIHCFKYGYIGGQVGATSFYKLRMSGPLSLPPMEGGSYREEEMPLANLIYSGYNK